MSKVTRFSAEALRALMAAGAEAGAVPLEEATLLALDAAGLQKLVTRPDGSKETEVDVFAPNTIGTVDSGSP